MKLQNFCCITPKRICRATSFVFAAFAMSNAAMAAPISFVGSGTAAGNSVSASASFDIVDNTLTIVLRNTSLSINNQDVPGSTLSGLFFNLTGNPLLTPVSATILAGSIIQGAQCSTALCTGSQTNVGGEFGYQATSFPGGADRGIASSGYLTTGLPGSIGNFNNGAAGTNLDDPDGLDGINFGIISAATGFDPNGGLSGEPLIQDSVTFVLTGVSGLTNEDISDVSFQYGTALTETNIPGEVDPVPEPSALSLMGFVLLGLGLTRYGLRRRI